MTNRLPLSVAYDSTSPSLEIRSLVEPLLSVCRSQTRSDGAYVYIYDSQSNKLRLIAWNGLSPSAVERFEAQLDAEAARWWQQLTEPAAASVAAWQQRRYMTFPEFVHHRFESALTVPLKTSSGIAGALTFCRQDAIAYTDPETALAASIGRSIGELASPTLVYTRNRKLEAELGRIDRKLADRKLIDRAKGVLQSDFGISEEEAYFSLRRTSRRRREPMAAVARFLIDNHKLPDSEQGYAS